VITKAVYENGVLRPMEKLNLRQGEEVEIDIKAMSDWRTEINGAIKDFISVAELAHVKLNLDDFDPEYLEAPHRPPSNLPSGKMAIYGFLLDGKWLKIGRVGPNSNARYTSQHYSPNATPSTLAKSILNDKDMWKGKMQPENIGDWIKNNTNRVNILLDSEHGIMLLALLEGFLHVRLRPLYERTENNKDS
jgi:predicted DNA-binding antitoxin AbrB/MazE fold protein